MGIWGGETAGCAGLGMFWYWVCIASLGNLFDYVPIRTFTDGTDFYQDMYAVERGLGWSPWTLLVVFGIPTALLLGYFVLRIAPETLRWLFPISGTKRGLLAVLTAFVLFDFYGAAGWSSGGPISHTMSVASVCLLGPVTAVVGVILANRRPTRDVSRS